MIIREFLSEEAEEVSKLIAKTLREVNIKDLIQWNILKIAFKIATKKYFRTCKMESFYVAYEENKIIGCGAIGPYWNRENESSLFTIFVLPEYQGKGIGRKIIETLEQDEYFLRANRIEIPASITATPFYLKMGYTFKGDITEPDEEMLIRLEKYR